jgi:hypothetical protein
MTVAKVTMSIWYCAQVSLPYICSDVQTRTPLVLKRTGQLVRVQHKWPVPDLEREFKCSKLPKLVTTWSYTVWMSRPTIFM